MKILYLLVICLAAQFSSAQVVDSSFVSAIKDLSNSEYIKAVNGYKQISGSKAYKDYRSTSFLLISKMPPNANLDALKDDKLFVKWITENLNRSNFASVKEAINLRKSAITLHHNLIRDNFEMYKLIGRATPEQLLEILKPDLRPVELIRD